MKKVYYFAMEAALFAKYTFWYVYWRWDLRILTHRML